MRLEFYAVIGFVTWLAIASVLAWASSSLIWWFVGWLTATYGLTGVAFAAVLGLGIAATIVVSSAQVVLVVAPLAPNLRMKWSR